VRHDIPQRDRLSERRGNLEIEIVVDVTIQIQFALFDLLHHRSPSKQLRDRPWPEQRGFRRDRQFLFRVSVTVALCQYQLPVFDHGNDGASDVRVFDLQRH
jgi:hypothetical protein